MKKLIVYLICSLFIVPYSCKSLSSRDTNIPDYDFKYDLYNHVKWYYRVNLKYPSFKELFEYYWQIVNDANDNKFSSFYDFEKAVHKNITGRESLLQHLTLYKDKIVFEEKDNSLDIIWKGKKWMKIKFDLCEMIKEKSFLFTYFYDSSGKHCKDFDYEDCFYKIRKGIRNKYLEDSVHWNTTHPCLLRYDREKGYKVYCPSNSKMKQSTYLNKLGCTLDTFLLNRDIQTIQFVINLPKDYFIRK